MSGDTIIAAAAGTGAAGRALVRASGPGVPGLIAVLCDGAGGGVPTRRWAGAARLRLGARTLPVLAVRCIAPASYTGEDTLDVLVPGNDTLVARVMDAMRAAPGVRDAHPGEFTARAFEHGRLTLEEAEAAGALVAAASARQAEGARRALRGESGALYRSWAEEIGSLAALVEAGIDFADQESVVAISAAELARRARALVRAMEAHAGAHAGREAAAARVRIALAGPPSAGKSTLLNALLERARAVASPVAGTTRDALVEPLTLRKGAHTPITVDLVDLAGLDRGLAAQGPIDAGAQAAAREEIERADVVLWCVPAECAEAPAPVHGPARVLHVHTKADRAVRASGDGGAVSVCALDGRGLSDLRRAMHDAAWAAGGRAGGADAPLCLARHAAAVSACAACLRRIITEHGDDTALESRATNSDTVLESRATMRGPVSPEIVADHLHAALDALGAVTGRVERDDIIGRIFASFCIGK